MMNARAATNVETSQVAANVRPLEEIDIEISPEEFTNTYLKPARPVVFRGIATWVKDWSFERLRREYGDRVVRASCGESVHDVDPTYRDAQLSEIIDSSLSNGNLHLVVNHFRDLFPAIGEDFEQHGIFRRYLANPRLSYKYLWLSPVGLRSTFHQDGSFDNLNFLVQGRKKFVLISPAYWDSVYPFAWTRSHVDPFNPDYERFPRFRNVQVYEADLGPGDILYIPRYWWHNALTLSPAMNVNAFALMPDHRWKDSAHIPFFARIAAGAVRRYPNFWFRDSNGRITPLKQAIRQAVWLGSRVRNMVIRNP